MVLVDFKAFYGRYGGKIWLFGILAVFIVLALGCLLASELFWDKFIYRYYWGPVEVDALESGPIVQSDGYEITQGYTLVSEITYGIVLILALYGLYRLLERFKIKIDLRFVLSVMPFFFLGGTLRVLEDAELLREPYVYIFISPLIYFVIGAVIVAALLFNVSLKDSKKHSLKTKLILASMVFVVFDIIYILIFVFQKDGFNYMVHPIVPVILSTALLFFLIVFSRKEKEFDPYLSLFLFGMFLLVFSIFVIMLWPEIDEWTDAYIDAHSGMDDRSDITTRPFAGPVIIFITIGITLITFTFARLLANKHKKIGIFADPINLWIIFGQMLDASATYVGVDFYGYSEKHPVPDFFFKTFGTSLVFIPIKLILALMVIYLIDISFKDELRKYPILLGLIKVIVIVLGLGPGTRDCVRLVMGV